MDYACDFLVIGGGSAGCVIARRLADHGTVILVEAGPPVAGQRRVEDITCWTDLLGSTLDWNYPNTVTGPVSNPGIRHSRGRMLGGSGSHNNCIAFVPPDEDFADWVKAGADGWDAVVMRPWFDRLFSMVTVSRYQDGDPLSTATIGAFGELGLPPTGWTGPAQAGTGWLPLSAVDRIRQSSEIAYLRGRLPDTLKILTDTLALRLTFDEMGNVTGAQTTAGAIMAARETVVCGGAFESPKLLLLSGIGPADELQALGITSRVDLPVGRDLTDHPEAAAIFRSRQPLPATRSNYADAGALITVDPAGTRPDILFHVAWNGYDYAHIPGFSRVEGGVCFAPNVARPKSRGSVTLASADPLVPPVIAMNLLSDAEGHDERLLVAAHRFARRLAATDALKPWLGDQAYPSPADESDAEIAAFVRQVCGVSYHPMGSCGIGRVVDADLRVKGVGRLRVADASVFPTPISVNLNIVTMALAERAAAMVVQGQ